MSEVLDIEAAAAQVDRAPATVRDWIRSGRLEPMRVGGRCYTTAGAIREAEREAAGFGGGMEDDQDSGI
jgi:hypothetical protein